jgi:hypothetical protein
MHCWQAKLVGTVLTLLLSGVQPVFLTAQQPPSSPSSQEQPQQPAPDREQQEDKASQEIINRNHLPDSPGAAKTQVSPEAQTPQSAGPVKTNAVEPTGTAAAQAGKVSGSAASRPAGAAIAPAKQRQVRSVLIKMGVIAGAGVALGAVAALSQASPSKPPGAH